MKITKHAETRSQQRGIPMEAIELLYNHGDLTKKPGGAFEVKLLNKTRTKLLSDLKYLQNIIEKASKNVIIINGENIITSYHL